MRRAFIVLLSLAVAACSAVHAQSTPSYKGVPLAPNVHCPSDGCSTYNVDPYILTRSKFGVGCLGTVPPGTTPNPKPPPQSYSVADVGKAGFPPLRPEELAMVHRIQRFIHSKTLRIAWVDATTPGGFIVFDATDGPCEVWAAGYEVLNGGCNEFYEPGENPYHTHPVPDCWNKQPWMSPNP